MTMTAREALEKAAEICRNERLVFGEEEWRVRCSLADDILALRDSLPQEKVKDHPARIEASGHEASVQNDAEAQQAEQEQGLPSKRSTPVQLAAALATNVEAQGSPATARPGIDEDRGATLHSHPSSENSSAASAPFARNDTQRSGAKAPTFDELRRHGVSFDKWLSSQPWHAPEHGGGKLFDSDTVRAAWEAGSAALRADGNQGGIADQGGTAKAPEGLDTVHAIADVALKTRSRDVEDWMQDMERIRDKLAAMLAAAPSPNVNEESNG